MRGTATKRKSDKMNKTKEESKERKDIERFYIVNHVKPYVQSEPIYFMDKETAQEYITTFKRKYYENYLLEAYNMCKSQNVLFIADEVQTGIGRTGKMLCCDHHGFKPDILILGKALSGGVFPVSAILASDEVMLTIKPGEHGSTFGGNPVACQVAISALNVIKEEKLAENAQLMGEVFRARLQDFADNNNIVTKVRGKGLLNAIVINDKEGSDIAWNICLNMAEKGLLAKPTHGNIIRFAPPLIINRKELDDCIDIIISSLKEFEV